MRPQPTARELIPRPPFQVTFKKFKVELHNNFKLKLSNLNALYLITFDSFPGLLTHAALLGLLIKEFRRDVRELTEV